MISALVGDYNLTKDKFFLVLVNLTIFSYLVFYALIPHGYAYGPAIILFCSLVTIWLPNCRVRLSENDWKILAVFILMFFVSIFLMLIHGFDSSGFDRSSKFFLAAFCLIFLIRYPVRPGVFWIGVAVSASLLGLYAILQVTRREMGLPPLFFDYSGYRVSGAENAIYFGNSALILGLFCLAALKWGVHQKHPRVWVLVLLLGFLLGLVGSLLSGTRSGWVTVPFSFLVLMRIYKEYLSWKRLLAVFGLGVVAIILILIIPQTKVYDRVFHVYYDISEYYVNDNPKTSIGYRFEMWKSGFLAFQESPLFGLGKEGYDKFESQLIDKNEIIGNISKWRHLHNQYIDTLAKQGILGLLALLIVFFVPLKLFYNFSSSNDPTVRSLAAAAMIFMIAYIDINLTQALFARNIGVMKFAFMVILLWSMLSAFERKKSEVIES